MSAIKGLGSFNSVGESRSIGNILVATGRLSVENAALVINQQRKDNSKFGDAAIALKLLTKDDIDFALSQQFDYAYLTQDDTSLSSELVAAYKPFSRVGENLRAVRSQLMLRWFNTDKTRKVLAVVSPKSGDGRSFVAANLAIVFAQQGQRTLLIDGDLRTGRQQILFKLGRSSGLSDILAERAGLEAALPIIGLNSLEILPAGAIAPNPQELLGRPAFGKLLNSAAQNFDVVIIDTPAGNLYSDAEIIATRSGAAIILARKNRSILKESILLTQRLQENGTSVIGSILNDT